MRFIVVGVLACLLMAGCSTGSDSDADTEATTTTSLATTIDLSPDEPSAPPVPVEVPVGEVGTMFEATPDLVRSTTTPFESWSQVSPNTIAIHFVTGTPECYGANAEVTETPTQVLITLHTGTKPDAVDKSCIMVAVYGTMQMTLSEPVGSREILNAT